MENTKEMNEARIKAFVEVIGNQVISQMIHEVKGETAQAQILKESTERVQGVVRRMISLHLAQFPGSL